MGHKSFGDILSKDFKQFKAKVDRDAKKRKQMPKTPQMKHSVSVDKVGKHKLGHGGMCLQNHLTHKEGERQGGHGLARV